MNEPPVAISREECFRRITVVYAGYTSGPIDGSEHEKALSWLKSWVDPTYTAWQACAVEDGRASRRQLLELMEDLGFNAETSWKILTESRRLWRLTGRGFDPSGSAA